MTKTEQQIARALECARKGDHARAEKIVKAVLAVEPTNFDALQIYGAACLERGDLRAALRVLAVATDEDPDFAPAQMNLANCLARTGRHEEALQHFDRALGLRPEYPQALFNRALSLKELGRMNEAANDIAKAAALAPDETKILAAHTELLLALGRVAQAREALVPALARHPKSPQLLCEMGSVLLREGRIDEAFLAFETAIGLEPRNAMPHRRLADAYAQTGKFEKAVEANTRAIAIAPDDAEGYVARAGALEQLGRTSEADADRDTSFDTYCRVSRARYEQGDIEGALKDNAAALGIKPRSVRALVWEGTLRCELSDYRRAFASSFEAREQGDEDSYNLGILCNLACRLCEWGGLPGLIEEAMGKLRDGQRIAPFIVLALADDPPLHKLAAEVSIQHLAALKPRPLPRPPAQSKIRIGYFSADFRDHPVLQLINSVFGEHDRRRFHVSGFSLARVKDASHQRIRSSFDEFHDVYGAPAEDITLLARRQKIDIAIDLTGYTADCRPEVFASRAAPVQVNFLGYPGTMGARFMDYIIADPIVIPADEREHYTEKVAYMPFSYQPNDRNRPTATDRRSRADCGLPEEGFVFCCFNDTHKILPDRFELWTRILKRVEGSCLWLLAADSHTQDNFRKEASARGVDPERLRFAPRLALPAHIARHRFADLFLDTGPYNAHTTSSDAIWAGVPVLTRPGRSFASRVAASLVTCAGAHELVTNTDEEYVDLAVRLAQDPDLFAEVKKKVLAARLTSPLFDVVRFTRDLERLYEEMIRRERAGLPPDHIILPGA